MSGARPRLVLLLGATVAAVPTLAAAAAPAPRSETAAAAASLRALLIVGDSKATIVTLAGKRHPVPARVQESPRGLSPDARLVAKSGTTAVLLGPVSGGAMRAVLRGGCTTTCPYGSDPTFAWSPDSRQLAATAQPTRGATLLRLFGRDGRVTQALTLPRTNPERGGRAYYRLLSWSPDGTRLLLTRADDFDLRALVILELETGRLRELPALSGPSVSLQAAWSPNGRFVAFTSSGSHDALDLFYVIDVASGRPVIQCPKDLRAPPTECPGGTVWAADSRSVFGPGIARYFLDGRRSREVRLPSGTPTPYVATQSGLIYASGRKVYLHSFATQRARLLYASSAAYLSSVLPLARLP